MALLLSAPGSASADDKYPDWEKIKDNNGIQVFTREVPASPILKVKTRVEIGASISAIQATLEEIDKRNHWIPYLQESRVLTTFNQSEALEYSLFAAPWPASDRDFVYRIQREQRDDQRIVYSMVSESSPLMPGNPDRVRAILMESTYILTALPDGRSRVELIFHADPGGWLPDWIINIIQRVLPYLILRNLRDLLTPTGDSPEDTSYSYEAYNFV